MAQTIEEPAVARLATLVCPIQPSLRYLLGAFAAKDLRVMPELESQWLER